MADAPHFSLPFRFGASGTGVAAAVSEQDTPEEIFDCVQAVLRTKVGKRIEKPEFGVADQTFALGKIDSPALVAACIRWEPRADVVLSEKRDDVDALIDHVTASVHTGPFNAEAQ